MARRRSVRLFTVEEVNALIPRLELLMQEIQQHSRELQQALVDVALASNQPLEEVTLEAMFEWRPSLRRTVARVESLIERLEATGAQFKGAELGLVDFPAEIDGERALLCWQYGEKEVAYWHPVDAGFAGRRPLARVCRRTLLQ